MQFAVTLLPVFITTVAMAQPSSYEKYRSDITDYNWNCATSIIQPLILGGTEVPIGTAQFVAGLRTSANSSSFCGGSLIHPKWVLTAAHCASSIVYVNVGTHFLSGTADGTAVKVLRKIKHPRFHSAAEGNDFLLLELESAVRYKPVKLAAADGSDERVGATATTLGWGTTAYNGKQSNVLLQVNVTLLSNDDCEKNLDVRYTMICAGGELNKDACQGDSGGPLVVSKNGTTTLVGLTSWGNGCGQLGYPGVYARVSEGRSFIDQYVTQIQWA